MLSTLKKLTFVAAAGALALGIASSSHAAPKKNVIAPAAAAQSGNQLVSPSGTQTGTQMAPRKDKIDLSVCDLATFDFDKCLGG